MIVSIILPYYKKKKFVEKSIRSILNQTFQKFELIIIYDDEDYKDFEFIKNFENIDKRIKVVKNTRNIGAGKSRNKGIKLSKGKYVAFIDSDDYWYKKKLFHQVGFMEKNNFNATHTSFNIVDEKDKILSFRKARDLNYKDLLKSCDIGLSTVVIKKKLLNMQNPFPNLKTKEDYVLWLKISKQGQIFKSVDKKLANWRKTSGSLSSSIIQKLSDSIRVYHKHEKLGYLKSLIRTTILSINYLKKK